MFVNYQKYLKSHNRFKSYLISQLNKIKDIITAEDVFLKLKKELLPYFINKTELKVSCNEDSYKVEIIESTVDNNYCNSIEHNDIINKVNDEIESECSTVDLNNNNVNDSDDDDDDDDGDDDNNYNNQTYLVDASESDEESLIEIAMSKMRLEDLKPSELKRLNIYELRNLLKSKELTVSKNGVYLTKKDMIRKLMHYKNNKNK
jgi:hypothetical protein